MFGDAVYIGFGNGVVGLLTADAPSGTTFETLRATQPTEHDNLSHGRAQSKGFSGSGSAGAETKVRRLNFENADAIKSGDKQPVATSESPESFSKTARFESRKGDWDDSRANSPDRPKSEDFNCFKVHKVAVSAITFNEEEKQVITGSLAGEVCSINEFGFVGSRKSEFKGAILNLQLVERLPAFFESQGMTRDASAKAETGPLIATFGKVIEDNAFAKNEVVLLAPRSKKIRKDSAPKISLNHFLTTFTSKGPAQSADLSPSFGGSKEEVDRLKKEIEELKAVNSKLLAVCSKLDHLRSD